MKSFATPLKPSPAVCFAILAALVLLPGCADFWRVTRPVKVAAGDLPPITPELPAPRPAPSPLPPEPPAPEPPAPPVPKPPAAPRPTAIPIPGKDGYVFSPYNNKVIDVKGYTPGTLVADPTYPLSERKFFRVP